MEQELDLSALNGPKLNPELFRRVWERVMPDQANSPLELAPPQPVPVTPSPSPNPPALSSPPPAPSAPPVCLSGSSQADLPTLHSRMDQAQANLTSLLPLARSAGIAGRTLAGMVADYRRALRQLSAARFLIAGQRYRPAAGSADAFPSLPLALRDQFIRSKQWQWACTQAGQETEDICLRELYEDLARMGSLHAGLIRSLLEQM